ncbi:MAG: Rnf-Nqr domain containing protein [Gammaproteobacteria bacterium]
MNELGLQAHQPASVWHNNPSLVHLLGLSPLLAVTDSLVKALALGTATMLAVLASAVAVYLFSDLIPSRWRYLWYSIILACLVSLIILLLQLNWYPLARELGIYPALIACNFALLLRMDRFKNSPSAGSMLLDTMRLGMGLMLALVLFATVREWLLYGSVFNSWQLLLPGDVSAANRQQPPVVWMHFARLQPAAFMLLALIIALGNWAGLLRPDPLQNRRSTEVERARVSGALKAKLKDENQEPEKSPPGQS